MDHPSGTDVLVVGGGVIGLGIAWRIATAGLSVVVVDDGRRERASWAAAGMLSPVSEVLVGRDELVELNLRSERRYPSFVAELESAAGMSVAYRDCGTLIVAADAAGVGTLEELYAYQRSIDLDVTHLSAAACRELEPALADGLGDGVLVADHQVENRRFEEALRRACRSSGVEFVAAMVAGLELGGGRVTGVRLTDGAVLDAGVTVLAAGCWAGQLGGVPEGLLPAVRPLKGQILRLRTDPADPLVGRSVRGLLNGDSIYLVPRTDGEVVVGATVEEAGFDTTVTAGAVRWMLDDGRTVVPGLDRAELVECWAGLRPASADGSPFLGPAAVDGLVVAGGHGRNGILLAPVTADAIAEVVITGEVPASITAFRPDRLTTNPPGAATHA